MIEAVLAVAFSALGVLYARAGNPWFALAWGAMAGTWIVRALDLIMGRRLERRRDEPSAVPVAGPGPSRGTPR